MKICIIGAGGSIGGYLAAHLAGQGEHEVSALLRSRTLAHIKEHGLDYADIDPATHEEVNQRIVHLNASDNAEHLGPQDVILIAMKTPDIDQEFIESLKPLVTPGKTAIVPLVNGVPFWLPHSLGRDDIPMDHVDPDGKVMAAMKLLGANIIGATVDTAAEKPSTGVVRGTPNAKLEHGAIRLYQVDEAAAQTCADLTAAMKTGGVPAEQMESREEWHKRLWLKVAGNAGANTVGAIFNATLDELADNNQFKEMAMKAIAEALIVAEKYGYSNKIGPERMAGFIMKEKAKLKGHYPSTAVDYKSGGEPELGTLIFAIQDMARAVGIETPHLDWLAEHASTLLEQRNALMDQGTLAKDSYAQAQNLVAGGFSAPQVPGGDEKPEPHKT